MHTADMNKFAQLITTIGELYGKSISKPLMEIYWQALKRFELSDLQRALQAHANNPDSGQFLPKPADVVRYIEGSGETKALQAWAKVEKAISHVGSYQSIAFDDPLIHAVLDDMGGWIKLCSITIDEMPFRANEFQKRYTGFVNKPPERHPKYLCGITERDNGKDGYAIKPPLLIGDPKKAEQVMLSGGSTTLSIQQLSQPLHKLLNQLPIATENTA